MGSGKHHIFHRLRLLHSPLFLLDFLALKVSLTDNPGEPWKAQLLHSPLLRAVVRWWQAWLTAIRAQYKMELSNRFLTLFRPHLYGGSCAGFLSLQSYTKWQYLECHLK